MRMTNGKELEFEVLDRGDYVVLNAKSLGRVWSLLAVFSSGKSYRIEAIGKDSGLNLDEKGRLAIDQPLPKPPVERFCWAFEKEYHIVTSPLMSEKEAEIYLPPNRVKLPWTRKTS